MRDSPAAGMGAGTLATRALPTTSTRLAILLAGTLGAGVAHLGTSTMPFQIGALMDGQRLSATAAGTFGFFEIGALALSMIIVSPFIDRYRPSLVCAVGAAIGCATHLIIFGLSPSLPVLCAVATAAGCGYGLVFAGAVSALAAVPNADRAYAIANGGALLLIVGLMAVLPLTISRFGALGPFLGLTAIFVFACPIFLSLRKIPRIHHDQARSAGIGPGAVAVLALWTSFSLGTGAVWSFAERIGRSLDLAPEAVGLILSMSTFCGLAGTTIAAMSAGKVPRIAALFMGLIGTGIACIMLCGTPGIVQSVVVYGAGVVLYWVFYMFLYSYMLGTAAALDPSGRVGTAGGGFERLGFAIGVPLGGILVDRYSFSAVGLLGLVMCVGLIPLCLPVLRRAVARRG